MPAQNKLDRRIEEGDENAVDLGSWNPKHVGNPMRFQGFHDELCAVHPCPSNKKWSDSPLPFSLLRRPQFCGWLGSLEQLLTDAFWTTHNGSLLQHLKIPEAETPVIA